MEANEKEVSAGDAAVDRTVELSDTAMHQIENIQREQMKRQIDTGGASAGSQRIVDLGQFGQSPEAVARRILDHHGHFTVKLMRELEDDMKNSLGSREEKLHVCIRALEEVEKSTAFRRVEIKGVTYDPEREDELKRIRDDIDAMVESGITTREIKLDYIAELPAKKFALLNVMTAINEEAFLLDLFEEASECYKKAEHLLKDDPRAHARVIVDLLESALDCYEKMLKFDPKSVDVLRRCAIVTRILKRYERTREYLERIIDLDCDENDYVFLSIVCDILGEREEAAKNAKIALFHNPAHVPALMTCVKMRALLGDVRWYRNYLTQLEELVANGAVERAEAIELFVEILSIKEKEAQDAARAGRTEDEQRILSEILDIDPSYEELDDRFLAARKRLLDSFMSADMDRAAELGMEALDDDPKRTGVASMSAIRERILNGKFQEALELINKALTVDDRNQFAQRELIFLYLYRLDFEKAEDEIVHLLKWPNVRKEPLLAVLRFGALHAYSMMLRVDKARRREIVQGINRTLLIIEDIDRKSAQKIRNIVNRISSNKLENY